MMVSLSLINDPPLPVREPMNLFFPGNIPFFFSMMIPARGEE
jgi:hypothetical protein